MLLNESFQVNLRQVKTKDGSSHRVAWIDGRDGDRTYDQKEKIKELGGFRKSGGVQWNGKLGAWYWYVDTNEELQSKLEKYIKPVAQYLSGVEKDKTESPRGVMEIIDDIMQNLDTSVTELPELGDGAELKFDPSEIKANLASFKEQLISCVSSDEFKRLMEPIIKYRAAAGHKYTINNMILMWIQDPQATLVKSKTNWLALNRAIKPNSPAIALYTPSYSERLSPDQKKRVEAEYRMQLGKTRGEPLTPGEKEELRIRQRPSSGKYFTIQPHFYDVRFTEPIAGKEDLLGNPGSDVKWFEEGGEETSATIQLYDAVITVAQNAGLNVGYQDDLGGARGVSKGGSIDVLRGINRDAGAISTLIHELSHEILHQNYLKSRRGGKSDWAGYFVGKSEGRECLEQQAELSAWIVMKSYGYDLKSNINYMGIWGTNKDNAATVFDTVARCATKIIDEIYKVINSTNTMAEGKKLNEKASGKGRLTPNFTHITGRELAGQLGSEFVDIYDTSKVRETEDVQECRAFMERMNLLG